MSQIRRQHVYKMREQGGDSIELNDWIQSESQTYQEHPGDVIWDEDELTGYDDSMDLVNKSKISSNVWNQWQYYQ
ncbi:hypothetical protein JOD43_001766 [Pullulanibacillus pueri]|uniref:Uncharacterized protein n=1 Tax=Pullulanibacillus pueri TaxID=1437324 RepID=A0A8J3ELQ5_9BACL|nr:hypothetical protein [Pullulanibacillus pueri]MBM7681599.1 hypothetical protein [Pullulanibacillus pueri]GGH79514.1 hypothetical protein GCM10007096_14550 [Pullulanibacillus pueri]